MIDLYKPKKEKKVKEILDYIYDHELAISDGDSYMNHFIHKHRGFFDRSMKNKIKVLQLMVNFRTYCDYWKCSQSRRLIEEYQSMMFVGYDDKTNKLYEGFMDDEVKKCISQKKSIFIVLDFIDYGLDDDNDDYYDYVPHACCLMLIPNGDYYEAFYINSHGKDLKLYKSFDYKISDQKKRTIDYEDPVDIVFLESYIRFLNTNHNLNIKYNNSEKYNYFGPDFQSGDNYGICFICPYIVWYYFIKYYDKTREISSSKGDIITLKSNVEMFQEGNLTECISGFLVDFNINYKNMYVKSRLSENYNRKYYVQKLDKTLERSRGYFVKKILNIFMEFFMQDM